MTLSPFLARGRGRHQALMLDTVVITRAAPEIFDRTTQTYPAGVPTTVYTGPCRVVVWRGTEEQAAETEVNVARLRIDLPFTDTTPQVQRRDTATVTSANPWLNGKSLVITELQLSTTATALQVIAEFKS